MLSGRVAPSGRLPVSIPNGPGAQPSTYLAARLGQVNEVSNIDPTPAFGFGHGLTYTSFDWSDLTVGRATVGTDGEAELAFTVRNSGDRDGTEVVQLYLHDPVASVVQPVQRLVGFLRLALAPGQAARVGVTVPADLASFTGLDGRRIVEPGELELRLGASSTDLRLTASVTLTGPVRAVDHTRVLHAGLRRHRALNEPWPVPSWKVRATRHGRYQMRTRSAGSSHRPSLSDVPNASWNSSRLRTMFARNSGGECGSIVRYCCSCSLRRLVRQQ